MFRNYFFLFFILISSATFSQNYSEEKIYSWYDKQVGIENSGLFRGIEYVETDRMINEKHKFFQIQNFQIGSVVYDGQPYYDLPLKYNVYDDLLLINLQYGERNSIFQLFSDKVDLFEINGKKFRYLKADNDSDIIGFYEVINEEGQFKIFKKHLKNRMEIRDRSVAYSEFSTADPDYIFQFKNEYFDLDNRRDLFSLFPNLKSEIRSFYNANRKQSRDNPDVFMSKLAAEMNNQISTVPTDI
ncbi:hypothetical protein APR41_06790 [Salegentibacter salinarum]|uniref:Uncharacterized protein n=1 Tax=Salegentibacter salinarum TaxID=447422 RepID=A0A2N0TQW6_9FLAO|nr:hypothetical protein [Salegentibacter salinarum]PKD17134.1 hypothetical protein APR41_06790 [Salegentibacter salinarum]SKB55479.1 hypothetical protein SAMN05660903_01383 [Salegentibacter salinarum]